LAAEIRRLPTKLRLIGNAAIPIKIEPASAVHKSSNDEKRHHGGQSSPLQPVPQAGSPIIRGI
jgi:hypothetical protein